MSGIKISSLYGDLDLSILDSSQISLAASSSSKIHSDDDDGENINHQQIEKLGHKWIKNYIDLLFYTKAPQFLCDYYVLVLSKDSEYWKKFVHRNPNQLLCLDQSLNLITNFRVCMPWIGWTRIYPLTLLCGLQSFSTLKPETIY